MEYGRKMRFLGVLSLLMTSLQAFQGKLESYGMNLSVVFRPACNISRFRAALRRKKQSALQHRRNQFEAKALQRLHDSEEPTDFQFQLFCVHEGFSC